MKISKLLNTLGGTLLLAAFGVSVPTVVHAESAESETPSGVATTHHSDGSTQFNADGLQLNILPADGADPAPQDLDTMQLTYPCDLIVQHPHHSSHFPSTINVVTNIQCQSAAAQLTLGTFLERNSPNPMQWHAPTEMNTGQASLQSNRAVGCAEGPGTFRGWAVGTIVPPAGYELEGPPTYDKYGTSVYVDCAAAASAEADVAASMTVTFVRSDLAEQ
jgi:hypothetical protein